MDQLNVTIQHKLNEKYPGRAITCIPEVDPISFKAFYRLIFEGRKTHFTYHPDQLAAFGKQYNKNVDVVAQEWVDSIHGMEQMLLQNNISV